MLTFVLMIAFVVGKTQFVWNNVPFRMRAFCFYGLFVTMLFSAICMTGCMDEIDMSNRYTFVGETVGSYLEKHEDSYGHFNYILRRSGAMGLLKAYGTYTCFAPTNEAITRYLVEQDSIWRVSMEPGAKEYVWTGITSPLLEDLTDSMCTVISNTHILAKKLLSLDMEGDVVPARNLNDRFLTMSFDVDENLHSIMFVNGARLVGYDEEVENGVVHTVSSALSPSTNTVPQQISDMPFLSIFYAALKATGLEDEMQLFKDENYQDADRIASNAYSDGGSMPYPPSRYYGYTAFCEPDEVFNDAGIYNLDDLYRQCRVWYPEATDGSFRSKDNALHKFIAYHLLDYHLLYTRLVFYNLSGSSAGHAFRSENKFPTKSDRYEYYETMQGTIIKVVMPRSSTLSPKDADGKTCTFKTTVFLNYAKDAINKARPLSSTCGKNNIPVNVRVLDPKTVGKDLERYPNFVQEALNGSIHLIDHLLVYDEDVMAGHVLNGIIRVDYAALIPELTNNHMRWYDGTSDYVFPSSPGFFIPNGYTDRVKVYSDECRLSYCTPRNSWDEYQGDLLTCRGPYDFAYRLPHVPPGTYEIRVSSINEPGRGIVQFYVDNEICGIPVNNNIYTTDPRIGYVNDDDTDDDGIANDKAMKNRGYLKLPNSYYRADGTTLARTYTHGVRYVVTTKYLSDGDHWLRIKNVNENDSGSDYYNHDYLELVPVGWLRREDLSLSEKRQ